MQAQDLVLLIEAAELGRCKDLLPAAQRYQTARQANYLLLLLQQAGLGMLTQGQCDAARPTCLESASKVDPLDALASAGLRSAGDTLCLPARLMAAAFAAGCPLVAGFVVSSEGLT